MPAKRHRCATIAAPVDHACRSPITIERAPEAIRNTIIDGECFLLDLQNAWDALALADEVEARDFPHINLEAIQIEARATVDMKLARLMAWLCGILIPMAHGRKPTIARLPTHVGDLRYLRAIADARGGTVADGADAMARAGRKLVAEEAVS